MSIFHQAAAAGALLTVESERSDDPLRISGGASVYSGEPNRA
jgi:hypothetical protein